MFALIVRRAAVPPVAQRVLPKQGVPACVRGEPRHSTTTVPAKAGESVRSVGMDDPLSEARQRKATPLLDDVTTRILSERPCWGGLPAAGDSAALDERLVLAPGLGAPWRRRP